MFSLFFALFFSVFFSSSPYLHLIEGPKLSTEDVNRTNSGSWTCLEVSVAITRGFLFSEVSSI